MLRSFRTRFAAPLSMSFSTMPSNYSAHNGKPIKGTFSEAEYQRRLDRLRNIMEEDTLDAVVLTSYHNINYFADFMFCYFGRSYGLVVTPDKATTVSAGIDGGQPYRRTCNKMGFDNITYTDWQRGNFEKTVKSLVYEQSPRSKMRVGVEFDSLNLLASQRLRDSLGSGVEFVDVSTSTMNLRTIKSTEEIALIKAGAAIADIGGAACVEAISEGVTEGEVALHSTRAMVRAISEQFPEAELMDTWTWFQSGINTDGAHNPVTSRKLESGDILSLNCFPMISGYYTALERTLFLDHVPSDRAMEVWKANVAVHERGLALLKPGARCCDVAKELNEMYAEYDLLQYRSFGYGHSFGVLSHYYGREAAVELREDIETVLEENMVVSMEPMVMIPEGLPGAGGYREHDILVIGKDATENITGFPYGPEHNIIKSR